jgi:hypothetical protein
MSHEDPKVIWLQPWCEGCDTHAYRGEGRQWCEDDAWGQCDECDQKSVKYVLAPIDPTSSTHGSDRS